MLIINPVSLLTGIRTLFMSKMRDVGTYADLLCTTVPSDKNLETYEWMYSLPKVREFLGARMYKSLGAKSYRIVNKTWESSLAFRREHLSDNQTGDIPIRVGQMAENAGDHVNELIAGLVMNGGDATLGVGYDEVSFFNTAHPALQNEGGTQSNDLTGTGTSLSALQTDFETAIKARRRFVDESGRPWRRMWNRSVVVAPPEQEFKWRTILGLNTVSTGGQNVYQGLADLLIVPELSQTGYWHLAHVGGVLRPWIFQMREPITLEGDGQTVQQMTQTMFETGEIHVGTYGRYNGGYGFWQECVRTKN